MVILKKPYFRGQWAQRLDEKGRLRIPARFREVLQNHYTDALILTMTRESVVAYPPEVWEEVESRVLEFSHVHPEQRAFMRYFVSSAVECEFDGQGRVLIPPMLRERAGLGREVVLAGMLTRFEIWDKAAWEKAMESGAENFSRMAEEMARFGL